MTLIGVRPEGQSIDRIDNNGNYSCGQCAECLTNDWPLNIRWATRLIQNRNQGDLNYVTLDGETRCLSEWAEIKGLTRSCVNFRFLQGIRGADLFKPAHKVLTATIGGETKTIAEWSRVAGIDQSSLRKRIRKQGEVAEVLRPKVMETRI